MQGSAERSLNLNRVGRRVPINVVAPTPQETGPEKCPWIPRARRTVYIRSAGGIGILAGAEHSCLARRGIEIDEDETTGGGVRGSGRGRGSYPFLAPDSLRQVGAATQ